MGLYRAIWGIYGAAMGLYGVSTRYLWGSYGALWGAVPSPPPQQRRRSLLQVLRERSSGGRGGPAPHIAPHRPIPPHTASIDPPKMAPAPTWHPRPALRGGERGVDWLSGVMDVACSQWEGVVRGGMVKRGNSAFWMEMRALIGWERRIDAESSQWRGAVCYTRLQAAATPRLLNTCSSADWIEVRFRTWARTNG